MSGEIPSIEIEQKIIGAKACPKLDFFRLNPAGICKIRFCHSHQAESCIEKMDNRFFDGRKLKCSYWDGKSDYRQIHESREEVDKRIKEFGQWLEEPEQ